MNGEAAPSRPAVAPVPRPVKGLAAVSFFNDLASEMVYPLLPAFVTTVLGGGAATLGALDGASDLTASVLRWFSGRLADRRGWRRPLILAGYLTAILVRPVISMASTAWQVVGFRIIDRLGKGLRSPARDALISELTPAEARGRAYGFHRAADHAGAVLGSLVAWALLQGQVDVRQVIEWSVLPGLVAFVVLAWVLRTAHSAPTPGLARPGPVPAPFRDSTGTAFWTPAAAIAALTVLRLPEALLLLRLQDSGVAVALIPLAWAGLHVVRSAAAYPGGALADRIGARTALLSGSVLYAGLAAGLASQGHAAVTTLLFLALGGVSGLFEPAERALIAALAPVRTGRGFGAAQAVTGLAALPAGLAFGALYQWAGAPVALLVSAGSVVLAAGVWGVGRHRHAGTAGQAGRE